MVNEVREEFDRTEKLVIGAEPRVELRRFVTTESGLCTPSIELRYSLIASLIVCGPSKFPVPTTSWSL
jgi:hypothetical protein